MKYRILASAMAIGLTVALLWLWTLNAPLGAIVQGGSGPPSVVLLHGYGSRAEDWLQFDSKFAMPGNTRFVYLQAPLRGLWNGRRGWWWLNYGAYVAPGESVADYSRSHPPGIQTASRLVRNYLEGVRHPIILGGFSQGAMTAAEIAFRSDQDLAGLMLLSGTTVDEDGWAEHFAGRRHLPIFIAHGRHDSILPFERMERFQARLTAFGLNVTWMPFDGGHGIPDEVVRGMNAFVRDVFQRDTPF